MGHLKSFGTAIIYVGLFLAVITFIPGLPPDGEFSEISGIPPPAVMKGLQNRLRGAEKLFSDEIKGPEYFASYDGELYTGVFGGYVVRVEEDGVVPIVKFGQKCEHIWEEEKCGRPLGLKFNDKGELFVIDAYYGIFKVDVRTKQYKNIVNISEPIEGKVPKIPNALDIAKNGDIYWTVSSTDFSLQDGVYTFLANPSGRLIRYNNAKKKNEVLLDNLGFANGVLLSDDESFLIVLESAFFRITKYHLKGPKAGQSEVLIDSLPGLPDNVHTDGQGGFLVSLLLSADADHPVIFHSLLPHPYIRKMLARLMYLMEAPFKCLQDIYPNPYAERLLHSIGSFESTKVFDTLKTSIILRMDKAGKVVDALYSDDKTVHTISSAFVHGNYLYLGSPFNEYIQRVPLTQALPDVAQARKENAVPRITVKKVVYDKAESKPVKATTAKPPVKQATVKTPTTTTPRPTTTTTTPRPTTTTPKPTTTTTPKPTTTTPKPTTQRPKVTTTTPKPVVSESAKPVKKPTNAKQDTPAPTTQQTTRRPPAQASTTPKPAPKPTTTPPPPPAKATGAGKKDNAKRDAKSDAKQSASNAKTEGRKTAEPITTNISADEEAPH